MEVSILSMTELYEHTSKFDVLIWKVYTPEYVTQDVSN